MTYASVDRDEVKEKKGLQAGHQASHPSKHPPSPGESNWRRRGSEGSPRSCPPSHLPQQGYLWLFSLSASCWISRAQSCMSWSSLLSVLASSASSPHSTCCFATIAASSKIPVPLPREINNICVMAQHALCVPKSRVPHAAPSPAPISSCPASLTSTGCGSWISCG